MQSLQDIEAERRIIYTEDILRMSDESQSLNGLCWVEDHDCLGAGHWRKKSLRSTGLGMQSGTKPSIWKNGSHWWQSHQTWEWLSTKKNIYACRDKWEFIMFVIYKNNVNEKTWEIYSGIRHFKYRRQSFAFRFRQPDHKSRLRYVRSKIDSAETSRKP